MMTSVTWVQISCSSTTVVLEGKGVYLKRSTSGLLRKMGSTSLLLLTLRVRVQTMDGLSEPTFSTKRSLSGSRSRWNKIICLSATTEKKIVLGSMKKYECLSMKFATNLIT